MLTTCASFRPCASELWQSPGSLSQGFSRLEGLFLTNVLLPLDLLPSGLLSDESLLPLLKNFEMSRLRPVNSGRYVTRHVQRIAVAVSN